MNFCCPVGWLVDTEDGLCGVEGALLSNGDDGGGRRHDVRQRVLEARAEFGGSRHNHRGIIGEGFLQGMSRRGRGDTGGYPQRVLLHVRAVVGPVGALARAGALGGVPQDGSDDRVP